MAVGYEIFAKIIPDTKEIDKLKDKKIEVEAKVKEKSPLTLGKEKEITPEIGEKKGIGKIFGGIGEGKPTGGGEATGGAEGIGGLFGNIGGIFGSVLAGVIGGLGIVEILKNILSFIMNLEPIKVLTEMIGTILKLFFLPLAIMLMKLLLPILVAIIRFMPAWLKMWEKPKKAINKIFFEGINLKEIFGFPIKMNLFSLLFPPFLLFAYLPEIGKSLKGVGEAITEAGNWLWNVVSSAGKSIWDFIVVTTKTIWEIIIVTTKTVWDFITGTAKSIWEWIVGGAKSIWEWIIVTTKSVWDFIITSSKSIWNWITGTAKSVWDWISTPVKSVWDWISTPVKSIWDFISTGAKTVGEKAGGVIEGIGNLLGGIFGDVVITDRGDIIRTSPSDYIFATRNPFGLRKNEVNVNINIAGVVDDFTLQGIAKKIRYEVERVV